MLEQSQASNCPETVQKRFLFRIPDDNLLSLVSPYTRSCVRIFRIPPMLPIGEMGGHKSARYFLIFQSHSVDLNLMLHVVLTLTHFVRELPRTLCHVRCCNSRTEALGCGMAVRVERSAVRFPTASAWFHPRGSDFVWRDSHMFTARSIGQPSRRPSEVLIQVS